MIPGITPPTDNLYKLIALFGLGILVLGVINISNYQDDLVKTKIEVENIEKAIFDTINCYTSRDVSMEKDMADKLVRFQHFNEIEKDLDNIEAITFEMDCIPEGTKGYISTQIDVIEVHSEASQNHLRLNYFLLGVSAIMMFIGFVLWYQKEQRWKDLELQNGNS